MTEKRKTIITTAEISIELHKKIKLYCFENDITLREFYEQALEWYLEKCENFTIEDSDLK